MTTETDLAGGLALVTGASQGIGEAIARRLVDADMTVWIVARTIDRLAAAAEGMGPRARPFPGDLNDADVRRRLVEAVERSHGGRLDVLVNNAGIIRLGTTAEATVEDFGAQLEANVVAPYALTQACLPMLVASQGQIVFVNSSAGKSANAGVGQYSATKHASRAFADSLRAEVNELGVRVTVVYPGRTATPLQETIHQWEQLGYQPDRLVQPADVAAAVLAALSMPRTAEMTELSIRPMRKG